jgi:NAD(P)-dependent dehydrogenase (short-subunit alcohol dehydrogenase family)
MNNESMNQFIDRVAIVTGAGRGLGRAYALALAAQGARVMVNDSGVEVDGSGSSASPAEDVAAEIERRGGIALANTDSVADAAGVERLFRQAIERLGGVDVLVNNAGIVRSRPLTEMNEADFDAVIGVHLRGTFLCCRAAMRVMRARGGRIINVTSGAAFDTPYPGTANYAAAKGGIISLTRVAAAEGRPHGIACNAVAPIARTRMSEQFLAGDPDPALAPDAIAAFVTFLAAAPLDITGQVFRVARGEVSVLQVGRRSPPIKLGAAIELQQLALELQQLLEGC